MPRANITALGWALTVTIWLLAGLMTASAFLRGEAAAALPPIVGGALTLNALAALLVLWLRRRD
ncbi:MAG: hypothetical protein QM688_16965 [Sphingomonas bacterium]